MYIHSTDPPARTASDDVLYHYTDMAGMIGIFSSKQLWATDTRYLNDTAEMVLLEREAMKKLATNPLDLPGWPDLAGTIDDLLAAFRAIPSTAYAFSVSFSAEPDLLSQWRGYGGHSGVAIGFDRSELENIADRAGGRLIRCDYDRSTREEIVFDALSDVLNTALLEIESEADIGNRSIATRMRGHQMCQAIRTILSGRAHGTKHESFREEHEYRIVLPGDLATLDQRRVRVGARGLSSYVPIDARETSQSALLIRHLVAGPPANELMMDALAIALEQYEVRAGEHYMYGDLWEESIFRSATPYLP